MLHSYAGHSLVYRENPGPVPAIISSTTYTHSVFSHDIHIEGSSLLTQLGKRLLTGSVACQAR